MASKSSNNNNNDSMVEVEKILGQRFTGLKIEYLVKWKGGDDQEWVPVEKCNCPIAIREFQKADGQWEEEYKVEGILDSIEDEDGNIEYLVKWEGFDENFCQWVKSVDMHCKGVIQGFENGNAYRSDKMVIVDRVLRQADADENGTECFVARIKGTKIKKKLTIDVLYNSPGGRAALCKFLKKFI